MSRQKFLNEFEIEDFLNGSDSAEDLSDGSGNEYVREEDDIEAHDLYSSNSDSSYIEDDETSTPNQSTVDPTFVSKSGQVWSSTPFQIDSGRFRTENIISLRPGATRYAKSRVSDIKSAFMLFFPTNIQNIILKHSNDYAAKKYGENYIEITSDMLEAYIGVLILAGVYRYIVFV